jgi:hypothetical protein
MLEDEATPPGALPPLLAVLQQAARHQHSLKWVTAAPACPLCSTVWCCDVAWNSIKLMPNVCLTLAVMSSLLPSIFPVHIYKLTPTATLSICRPRFRDLVDLLLGWALEPALPEAARQASLADKAAACPGS